MLKTRVLTALVLAVVVLGVLFGAAPRIGVVFFGLTMLVAALEWSAFAGLTQPPARIGYLLLTAVVAVLAWQLSGSAAGRTTLMAVAALFWIVCFLWLTLDPGRVPRSAAAVAGLLVLVPAGVGIGRLLLAHGVFPGAYWLFFMLLLVWAADIGAYFAGRAWGKHRLAPLVSPNKTVEGLAGGLALAGCVTVGGALFFGVALAPLSLLALAVVLASVIGDLTESMMKRAAGLKDSGKLLPGHGGVLDRIDSITASVPFYVLGLGWLGVLG